MNQTESGSTATCCEQVYLIERDSGLLCRILGLYAARALDVLHVDYVHAAQEVMQLSVKVAAVQDAVDDVADTLRILVARAATLVGVIAAAERPTRCSRAAAGEGASRRLACADTCRRPGHARRAEPHSLLEGSNTVDSATRISASAT